MTSVTEAEAVNRTLAQCDTEADLDKSLFQLPIQRHQTQIINTSIVDTEDMVLIETGPADANPRKRWHALRSANDSSQPEYKLHLTDMAFERLASGDSESLERYLEAGALIERENLDGLTLLVMAIRDSNVTTTRLLLQKGADAQHRVQGKPPLFHAVRDEDHGPVLIRLLLDHGANINSTCGLQRMNALHWAAAAGMVDAADYLISRGISIESTCAGEHTALHVAAGTGHLTVVRLLLAQGAELAKSGESGGNIMRFAASMGHLNIVKLCVEEGLPIDDCDERGLSESRLGAARGASLACSNIFSGPDERM